ncbi:polyketide synthase [Penicillium viridicatum]|nr:polyketide synthase [Penicillium viridicatum]
MTFPVSNLPAEETVLLFGPQALSSEASALNALRTKIVAEERHRWIRHTIADLPSVLQSVLRHCPDLARQATWASSELQQLSSWLSTGSRAAVLDALTLPNTILTPLVVTSQLIQYIEYLDLIRSSTNDRDDFLPSNLQATSETLGLCTGILSALAVSSSNTRLQLENYGSVAIRLAMLIGLVVDARDLSEAHRSSKSMATRWHSEEQKQKLLSIIASDPETYISVHYDENRATITSPAMKTGAIRQVLISVGISVSDIALRGRFHWHGHAADIEPLIKFCDIDERFQFADTAALILPTRSFASETPPRSRPLHAAAIRSILVEPAQWVDTVKAVHGSTLISPAAKVVSFGAERCIPPSILTTLSDRVLYMEEQDPISRSALPRHSSSDDIAVVGMSAKVAGADDLEGFWDILCKGASQHKEVPAERFNFETVHRKVDPKRKWFGNFLNDPDKFDHKFFKKSPREAESMDPQQRQLLQIAYQAVEQTGYFQNASPDVRIGCYMGVCCVDYENNLACYEPNAFTATGHLRGFIAGKVSHYFGWTGPALTIDTACSSSAVAVHQACRSILNGECTAALAGGTHVMTSPLWFQNLAGASFLSKTGQCKPFDGKADGYCRGEGVATVFLKKLSAALEDGDQILGVISGTAVQQNENCTPIVVPNEPSLSGIFGSVLDKAGLCPEKITVVEAHGTGTPVGDPVEYSSVSNALGGPRRSQNLILGSVKGLVGHCECASGIVSLIKVLLMIQKGIIPPQASFDTLNPAIQKSPTDGIQIARQVAAWDVPFRAALINNYGASGSNASMVITQPPPRSAAIHGTATTQRVPFWFSALDEKSLQAYVTAFLKYLHGQGKPLSLQDLAFNLSRQSNRSLQRRLLFASQSVEELQMQLAGYQKSDPIVNASTRPALRPLVLCFGGQVSKFIGLTRSLYEEVAVLRGHLNRCNRRCIALGIGSIFPAIFQRTPIDDIVTLQTSLFALQYACAKSWMDAGAQPVAVLGHSFGELTALCVADSLCLDDALNMIAARARVIRDFWGPEGGSMMALEGDLDIVQQLLVTANSTIPDQESAEIACYNGPRSFTVAGSTRAVEAVDASRLGSPSFASVKAKRLDVTNAFHSKLVDPLRSRLNEATRGLTFREPSNIRIERSTNTCPEKTIDNPGSFVADHMRLPVYFHHALQRVDNEFPNAIYLEAGSSSTITVMASRALQGLAGRHFQAVNITTDRAWDNLVDTTLSLWNAGLGVSFWAHVSAQTTHYAPLLLPPYQFEKSRHWLENKRQPQKEFVEVSASGGGTETQKLPETLLSFVGYQDPDHYHARFRVNTTFPEYEKLMTAHLIINTAPICPATVQMDIAVEGLKALVPTIGSEAQPQIHGVDNQTPICADRSQSVWLDLTSEDGPKKSRWRFRFSGTSTASDQSPSQKQADAGTTFTTGTLIVLPMDDEQTRLDFSRYARLTGHARCIDLLDHSADADEILQGRTIYKTFANIVDYGEQYRGLQRLVGKGQLSAGRVLRAYNPKTWFDAHLSDAFAQVVGIWLNCMTERDTTELYVARGFEKWIRSPDMDSLGGRPNSYDVLAYHQGPQKNSCLSDIFVFHPTTGQLVEAILGFQFIRVPRAGMVKLLTRLTRDEKAMATNTKPTELMSPIRAVERPSPSHITDTKVSAPKKQDHRPASPKPNLFPKLSSILADLTGTEPEDIRIDSELAEIGVDSLMAMEVVSEIENAFKCSLSLDDVADITTMAQLVRVVQSTLDPGNSEASLDPTDDENENQAPSPAETELTDVSVGVGVNTADLLAYFAECLGIDEGELSVSAPLKDLGVDSLLSMEVRGELEDKFGFKLDDSLVLEELSIEELHRDLPGAQVAPEVPDSAAPPASAPTPQALLGSGPAPSNVPSTIPVEDILAAFRETKSAGDSFITSNGCSNYVKEVLPKQTQLCILHTLEAFEEMGSSIRALKSGERLTLFTPRPEHIPLIARLAEMLETQSGLIKVVDGPGLTVLRTEAVYPAASSTNLKEELRQKYPEYQNVNELIFYVGSHLHRALRGEIDGIKLIFGNVEGRKLVSGLYGDWIMNICYYQQMEDFLSRLVSRLPPGSGPLRILEMGAGTGGTSKWLIPLLARLEIPVEYTFTDLAPSLVAGARKTFKQYASMMNFRAHDIEQEPADDLINTQHIVVASNAVHATHSLVESATKLKKVLQPNGILMMLEMIEPLYWIDMIFGLFEGWWLFVDGRRHALTPPARWRTDLQAAGFGRVDWSDGLLPENTINKLIIAVACDPDPTENIQQSSSSHITPTDPHTLADRKRVVDDYVRKHTLGFDISLPVSGICRQALGHGVVITGGTGSVGAHVVARLAQMPSVTKVICLNRRGQQEARERQMQSLATKGLSLPEEALAKIQVLETDLAKPQLGLSLEAYKSLLESTTHIMHNAWAMSIKRPVQGFESQFRIMRNLIEFARDLSSPGSPPVSFQFISSIATVGHYPIWKQDPHVPEEPLSLDAVLPIGYGDAKYICELMLDHTLRGDSQRFHTSTVRLGQVGASSISGYWNPVEHLSFLFKSAQTINHLPDLHGPLSWTPVDDVAGTLVDLLFVEDPYPIYHIDNPIRQPWQEMLPILADALGIPPDNRLPFDEWVACVRDFPANALDKDQNPATVLADFLEQDFQRMSAGGLLLDTTKCREHSPTLRAVGPVSPDLARKFIQYWRSIGFIA